MDYEGRASDKISEGYSHPGISNAVPGSNRKIRRHIRGQSSPLLEEMTVKLSKLLCLALSCVCSLLLTLGL